MEQGEKEFVGWCRAVPRGRGRPMVEGVTESQASRRLLDAANSISCCKATTGLLIQLQPEDLTKLQRLVNWASAVTDRSISKV